jgi:hypothetical protein
LPAWFLIGATATSTGFFSMSFASPSSESDWNGGTSERVARCQSAIASTRLSRIA